MLCSVLMAPRASPLAGRHCGPDVPALASQMPVHMPVHMIRNQVPLSGTPGGGSPVIGVCSALPPQPSILETCALIMKIMCLEIFYVVK